MTGPLAGVCRWKVQQQNCTIKNTYLQDILDIKCSVHIQYIFSVGVLMYCSEGFYMFASLHLLLIFCHILTDVMSIKTSFVNTQTSKGNCTDFTSLCLQVLDSANGAYCHVNRHSSQFIVTCYSHPGSRHVHSLSRHFIQSACSDTKCDFYSGSSH